MGLKYSQIQMSLWLKVGGGLATSIWVASYLANLHWILVEYNAMCLAFPNKAKLNTLLLHDFGNWIHSTKFSRVVIQPMTYSHI